MRDTGVTIHCVRIFMIDDLLAGNVKFRETCFKENYKCYSELAKGQNPPCSGSVVPIHGSRRTYHRCRGGCALHQRNIGNVAPVHDWNFATVLEYALNIPEGEGYCHLRAF